MNRDELADYVQRVTRQAVPDTAGEPELLDFLEFRYRWVERAWYGCFQRLLHLGQPAFGPAEADGVSRPAIDARKDTTTT